MLTLIPQKIEVYNLLDAHSCVQGPALGNEYVEKHSSENMSSRGSDGNRRMSEMNHAFMEVESESIPI